MNDTPRPPRFCRFYLVPGDCGSVDVVDKAFRRLIDRMDLEEVVQGEPLMDEGIPVVRE